MTSLQRALVALGICIAFVGGVAYWQATRAGHHGETIRLTAEDMQLIVNDQPQLRAQLAGNEEARKRYAKNLKTLLAIAEEARARGMVNTPEIRRQLDLQRNLILAQTYIERQQTQGQNFTPDDLERLVPQAEVDAFLQDPTKIVQFNRLVETLEEQGMRLPEGEERDRTKSDWARINILARKAIEAGIDRDRKVQLQLMLQQARAINAIYGQQMQPRLVATDEDIETYLREHPELNAEGARQRAEEVLRRVRAGEDFAALAREFSADPGSKDEGGELGWMSRGETVAPFDAAMFALQPGQTSDLVETNYGFHIIQVEERRAQNEQGQPAEQARARHILIATPRDARGQPANPRDQARAAIEEKKADDLINGILERTHVEVAENFVVEAPPPSMSPFGMPGMPPGGMGGEDEMELPPPPSNSQPPSSGANSNSRPANQPAPSRRGNRSGR